MRPRWLIVGLVVSVALNLFLVGAGAGIVALGVSLAKENAAGRPGVFFWATNPMPQPSRHKVRSWLAGEREQVRADVERSFAVRVQAWDALAAAKPDPAAIKQGLAQGRQLDLAVRTKVEDGVVDQVAALPPAERAAFAAGMHKALQAQAPPASR
jgi:uncharacterized membrane protein